MREVGIKTLKNRLSEYVRAAAAGEGFLVTDRGHVVAELIPSRVQAQASQEAQCLAELERSGLLTPANTRARARLPRRRPLGTLDEVLRELDESRTER
jgi:prevent-host-death family protein